MHSSSNNVIAGSIAQGNDGGMSINGNYNTITDNNLQGNTTSGLAVSGGNHISISGNIAQENATGFDIGSGYTTLTNNHTYSNTIAGFSIAEASDISFVSNTSISDNYAYES